MVRGELGTDGRPTRAGTYTIGQRRKIIRYLERKGFSREQVRPLIEDGVVEINRIDPLVTGDANKIWRNINKGKDVFISKSDNRNTFYRISRVLEDTNNGVLAELEALDDSGQVFKQQAFFPKKSKVKYDNLPKEHYPYYMTKIIERTDSGFVIDLGIGDQGIGKVFLSFEKAIEHNLLPHKPTSEDYRKLEDLLNDFISNNNTGNQTPGQSESIDALADSFNQSLLTYTTPFLVSSPEVKSIFLAAKSTRKKISSSELNFSPSKNTETESDLAARGFKKGSYGAVDEVNEWSEVRKQLQALQANPYTTHIEPFADHIPDQIAYIKEGLLKNYDPEASAVSAFPRISFGKKAEVVYFLMTHEVNEKTKNIGYSNWHPNDLMAEIKARISRDVSGVVKLPDDPDQKQKKIKDLADTFMGVYNQALQHQ